MEGAVRESVSSRLGRGKVDCTFRLKAVAGPGLAMTLNEDLVAQLGHLVHRISALAPVSSGLSIGDLLRWPGVVQTAEVNQEAVQAQAIKILNSALKDLQQAREREGEKLKQLILERVSSIDTIVAQAKERVPQVLAQYRAKLTERLKELKEGADPQRLEQELILVAQKIDVAEELDRLGAHTEEVARVLGQSGPIGRRLDFLMQELNREANTLGSKSIDVETTRFSVDMKVLIEQMREQVQNIE